jgi:hypothetical protein
MESDSSTLQTRSNSAIIAVLPHLLSQRRGGEHMHILINLLLTIIASIVSYYVCKWLDDQRKGQ